MSIQDFELEVREDPVDHVDFDLNATGKLVFNCSVILYGWSIKNVSTSTEANIDIYDGADASGKPTFPINLAGNESSRDWFDRGVHMKTGVYLNVTAQEVKGSIFFRHHRPHG